MTNYQNGKIYSIRSRSRPDLIYIGSTTQSLSRRLSKHKAMSNQCSSRQIIDVGDAYIELIEECECDNKDQLLRREGQLIRSMDCVNKRIEGRTTAEWRQDNREQIEAQQKQYYQANKDKISKYREANKDKILTQQKQHKSMKIECGCGSTTTRGNIAKHKKTAKHKIWQDIHDFIHS